MFNRLKMLAAAGLVATASGGAIMNAKAETKVTPADNRPGVTMWHDVSKNNTVSGTAWTPPPPVPAAPQSNYPVEGGMVTYEHRF